MAKVCHITSAHGVEDVRIFHKECISLAKAGYEVYLVERGDSYEKNGVRIIGLGEMPSSRFKRMTFGAKRAYKKALLLNCDLYHLHDPELLQYGLKLKRQGKKVVFDSHELTREQIRTKPYLPPFLAKMISFLYSKYENYVLRRLDGVIFPCPVDGRFPLPAKRKVYLNNLPRLSELYEKYNPECKKEPNTVCTLGSLTYNRGIKHLILAAEKANCKVYLGGVLSPAEFELEIKTMKESKRVEFLGYLNREQVQSVYERSQVGVSALLNVGQYASAENLSTKVYECMAMGLPVIMTEQPYNRKIVNKYEFGICVDPENIDEFAKAIRELLDNPSKAKCLGQNGRRAVKELFNWEKEEEKLFNLYSNILEK